MPRLARVFVPAVPCHVTLRGNDRQDIVRCDGDRLRLLGELGTAARRHGLAIHAYVLMTNHFHLLATGREESSLPKAMQAFGAKYVAYFNRRHGRTGTLCEGRYKSVLVASPSYVMNCLRYIELNPVRAGMVSSAVDYIWSSCRLHATGQPDDLVTPHEIWIGLGDDDEERRERYRSDHLHALDDAMLQDIRRCTRRGLAIGNPVDCAALEKRLQRRLTPASRGWKKGRARGAIKGSGPFIEGGRGRPG